MQQTHTSDTNSYTHTNSGMTLQFMLNIPGHVLLVCVCVCVSYSARVYVYVCVCVCVCVHCVLSLSLSLCLRGFSAHFLLICLESGVCVCVCVCVSLQSPTLWRVSVL